jgi:hypothetical protein
MQSKGSLSPYFFTVSVSATCVAQVPVAGGVLGVGRIPGFSAAATCAAAGLGLAAGFAGTFAAKVLGAGLLECVRATLAVQLAAALGAVLCCGERAAGPA